MLYIYYILYAMFYIGIMINYDELLIYLAHFKIHYTSGHLLNLC